MHYAPQILLCCTVCISVFTLCVAKEPLGKLNDPELLKKFTKEVETVLSPTLIEELQGAQSNRSAVNAEQTVPRNPEQPRSINDKKPDIQIDNHVYPYHYERSYHYEYPPKPRDDSSRTSGYTDDFYDARFRPKSHVTDTHDPTYYRSELYNPFGASSSQNGNLHVNSNTQSSAIANYDIDNNGGVKRTDSASAVFNGPTPLPPSSFAHPEILTSPPQPNPFPSTDFGSYRHGVFGRPLVNNNYFRPNGDLPGHYLPHRGESFSESIHQRPVESFQPLPPLDLTQNHPNKEFQGYNEHRSTLPGGSPFLGSFFPRGYQSQFYDSYRPSEHFNNLFSDNFTRNFPLRPSFSGFYSNPNYLPPPSPSHSTSPTPADSRTEDPVPLGGSSSQPILTTKPDDPAPVAAASNSNYELKLFFPARDEIKHMLQPSNSKEFTYISKNFRI